MVLVNVKPLLRQLWHHIICLERGGGGVKHSTGLAITLCSNDPVRFKSSS